MRLKELFIKNDLELPFENYHKDPKLLRGMPPLDNDHLSLEKLVITERTLIRSIVLPGDLGLLITYKKYEGAAMSLSEKENGDLWQIEVLSGAKSRKSMRVTSAMEWKKYLADTVKEHLKIPDCEAKQLAIEIPENLENIAEAKSEHALNSYYELIKQFKMRYSDLLKLYVTDTMSIINNKISL